jgi:probable rRNA maturation factor
MADATTPGRPPSSATVEVLDEQDVVTLDLDRWGDLVEAVVRALGVPGPWLLTVRFVDRATMAALNRRHLDGDGPTDVLSFPLDGPDLEPAGGWAERAAAGPGPASAAAPTGDRPPVLLGDLVICAEVAAANAPGHAGTLDDEIALLVVHGVLHLVGMDHAEPDERRAMQAAERDLLARHHGALSGDPWAEVAS